MVCHITQGNNLSRCPNRRMDGRRWSDGGCLALETFFGKRRGQRRVEAARNSSDFFVTSDGHADAGIEAARNGPDFFVTSA